MRIWPCLLVLSVVACTPDYPMDKPGTWSLDSHPSANDANLRAMVVDPYDLAAGAGASDNLGPEAGFPVRHLLSGHEPPLPASSSLQINVIGSPTSSPQDGGSSE